jgi:putative transposase
MPRPRKPASPFRYFNSSPEVIRLVVMMYVRFPLSLRNVEDLLAEPGIDLCHEPVRHGGTGSARCSPQTYAGSG